MSDETDLGKGMRHLRTAQEGLRKATAHSGSPGLRAAVTEMVNSVEEVNLAVAKLGQTKDEGADKLKQIVQILNSQLDMPDFGEALSVLSTIRNIATPKRALTVRDLLVRLDHADPDAVVTIEFAGMDSYPVTDTGGTIHSSDGSKAFGLYSDSLNEKTAHGPLRKD